MIFWSLYVCASRLLSLLEVTGTTEIKGLHSYCFLLMGQQVIANKIYLTS